MDCPPFFAWTVLHQALPITLPREDFYSMSVFYFTSLPLLRSASLAFFVAIPQKLIVCATHISSDTIAAMSKNLKPCAAHFLVKHVQTLKWLVHCTRNTTHILCVLFVSLHLFTMPDDVVARVPTKKIYVSVDSSRTSTLLFFDDQRISDSPPFLSDDLPHRTRRGHRPLRHFEIQSLTFWEIRFSNSICLSPHLHFFFSSFPSRAPSTSISSPVISLPSSRLSSNTSISRRNYNSFLRSIVDISFSYLPLMSSIFVWISGYSSPGIIRIITFCFTFVFEATILLRPSRLHALQTKWSRRLSTCVGFDVYVCSSSVSTKTLCLFLAKYAVICSMMTLSLGVPFTQVIKIKE